MSAKLNIGTSGWHYQHWRGSFYPAKLPPAEMFAWYCWNAAKLGEAYPAMAKRAGRYFCVFQ